MLRLPKSVPGAYDDGVAAGAAVGEGGGTPGGSAACGALGRAAAWPITEVFGGVAVLGCKWGCARPELKW